MSDKSAHLLIVDDEENIRSSLRRVLRRDYELSFAASAAEALALVSAAEVPPAVFEVGAPPCAPAPLRPPQGEPAPIVAARHLEGGWGHISATLTAPAEGFIIVSEAWAPGWEARVNGGEWRPTARANHLFQGLPSPPGELRVELRYRPRAVIAALWLALCAALCAALAWVALPRPLRAETPAP